MAAANHISSAGSASLHAEIDDASLVTDAVLRAADLAGLAPAELGAVIGVSASKVSRMRGGAATLRPGQKDFELALLLLRVLRSAGALYGSDFRYTADWLRAEHLDLTPNPLERMRTVTGLVDVATYLDHVRGRG